MGAVALFLFLRDPRGRTVPEAAEDSRAEAAGTAAGSPPESRLGPGRALVPGLMGLESFAIETVPSGDGWVGLPVWAFFGPEPPVFQDAPGRVLPFDWVIWADGSPVVLCRVEAGETNTPGLGPWDPSDALGWQPLRGGRATPRPNPATIRQAGPISVFDLLQDIDVPAVFLQPGRIVGWTFGQAVENGYLWTGPAGRDLNPMFRTEQLRGLVWDVREAHFARAAAMEQTAHPLSRLETFASGFARPALLHPEDLPPQLRPAAITSRMHRLALGLLQEGAAGDVLRVLDDAVIRESSDVTLLEDACLAVSAFRDFGSAVSRVETARGTVFASRPRDIKELDVFEARLYKDWLGKIIKDKGYGGMDVFDRARRRFPDDLELHFLGVEAAVMERAWSRASELLAMKTYSAAWADKVRMYETVIDQGRADDESAIIRFNPGEKNIPVHAYLNDREVQKFFIDTGAEVTTIPRSTADALGFTIDDTTRAVLISGVGENVAYEVTLDSIELVGQRVYGLKAYVLDLPSLPEWGLLGIDFLKNFQVDIDNKRGILKLRKK